MIIVIKIQINNNLIIESLGDFVKELNQSGPQDFAIHLPMEMLTPQKKGKKCRKILTMRAPNTVFS